MWRDCTRRQQWPQQQLLTAVAARLLPLGIRGVSLCATVARHSNCRRQNATVRREPLFLRKEVVSWSTPLPLCGRYATYRQLIVQQITDFIGWAEILLTSHCILHVKVLFSKISLNATSFIWVCFATFSNMIFNEAIKQPAHLTPS